MAVADTPPFFCPVAADPRLEFGPEGGGDFSRGDVGQCGVLSPDPPALLGTLGNRDTESDTPPACNCGAFAADNARCIAAADGCVGFGLDRCCGRLSLRMGDVLRDVLGLEPADTVAAGTRLFDDRFRKGGAGVADAIEGFRDSLGLRGADIFAVVEGSVVSAWGLNSGLSLAMMGRKCAHHNRRRRLYIP